MVSISRVIMAARQQAQPDGHPVGWVETLVQISPFLEKLSGETHPNAGKSCTDNS